jgi:hypothetical protein
VNLTEVFRVLNSRGDGGYRTPVQLAIHYSSTGLGSTSHGFLG